MSYQVIARKWRPQSFDEVSGQAHVTTALRNAIRSDRIPHAMLLTGPRGVGKTTLARLIARCLNCEKGPTVEPCGSCPPCTEITEGRSTDVQEIDAASRTGVDDMREVIESIRYAAAPGKYRIFIVDEVHMLSGPAFNALLKTLEEPPPRSLFVFATTNPEKIPFTVLSRCQRHDLRRIALSTVGERLAEICESEGIAISPSAVAMIAREGDGSMRDAQTLLDQIVAYSSGQDGVAEITDEVVADVLDLVDRRVLREIALSCIEGDVARALEHVTKATSGGSEARRVADALLEFLRDLVVLRVAPEGEGLFEGTDEERAELIELAGRTEPARLRRMFRALVREIEDLSWAPQPTAVLEMAVIRLATMPAGDDVGQLLARLDQLERRLAAGGVPSGGGGGGGGGGAGGGRVSDRGPRRRAPEPTTGPGNGTRASSADADADAEGFDPPPAAGPAASAPPAPTESKPPARPPMPARTDAPRAVDPDEAFDGPRETPVEPARFDDDPGVDATAHRTSAASVPPGTPPTIGGGAPPATIFDRFKTKALELDRSKFASLDGTTLVGIEGNVIRIGADAAFHVERLRARQPDLEALATRLFGKPTKITVEIATANAAREQSRESREQERRQRQEALNSEPVNLAIEILKAEIVEIRPLGANTGRGGRGD
ncbi:MAG: DNA polymerase III subunit gamma/tau [bacterium]|nr:DNA polymerase III subunit gamma/tau [bacterium]